MGKKQSKVQTKKKQKMNVVPQGIPAPYGIRKTFNHIIPRKKKRVNSLVKMKPLKGRYNTYEVPEFCPNGYDMIQFDLYREQLERIKQLTKQDLKQILKMNKQDNSPQAKQQLLNRCADGYALGKIPTCPHCFGTNPVYDKYKGNYFCPGYKQGDSFIKCQSTFSREELPRIKPWNNNFEQRQTRRLERTQRKLKHQRQYHIQYKKNKKKRLQRERRRELGQQSQSQGQQNKTDRQKQQEKSQFQGQQNKTDRQKQQEKTAKKQAQGNQQSNQEDELIKVQTQNSKFSVE